MWGVRKAPRVASELPCKYLEIGVLFLRARKCTRNGLLLWLLLTLRKSF